MNKEIPERSFMITGVPSVGKTELSRELYKLQDFIPHPPYTTRPLRVNECSSDMRSITEEEFLNLYALRRLIEGELNIPYERTGYLGKRYGSPVDWMVVETHMHAAIGFVSFSTLIASVVKRSVGENVAWIHLTASERVRRIRLAERKIPEEEISRRLANTGGDSHAYFQEADLVVDTSSISLTDEASMVLSYINRASI